MPEASAIAEFPPERAWAPYAPDEKNPWDAAKAAHLLRRAGAGPAWNDITRALHDGPEKTIDRLLRGDGSDAFNREIDGYEIQGPNARPIAELRGWWLRRMIETPCPLLERMTLFWHGWFAINAAKVAQPRVALDHVRMLRDNALGSFDAMLARAVRDPATLITAGGIENFKAKANEHLAEHMLSVLTVGEGQFGRSDVSDTARAFTGLFVRGGQLRDIQREHDGGQKTLLGHAGSWTDQDFARIAAAHPATARRLTRAIYRYLVAEDTDPSDGLLEPLAAAFSSDRSIRRLVETILRSNLFFSARAYRRRIKGPVEFAVGLCRAFETTVPTVNLGHALAELGQDLYHPPTSKGWAGGVHWINRQAMAGRINLAQALFHGETRLDVERTLAKYDDRRADPPADRLLDLLLQGDRPKTTSAIGESGAVAAALAIVSSPEYQMA